MEIFLWIIGILIGILFFAFLGLQLWFYFIKKNEQFMCYLLILVLLFLAELFYFRIADRFNIIDKPNERSSHSTIVLRGGGIIFLIGAWVWSAFFGVECNSGKYIRLGKDI